MWCSFPKAFKLWLILEICFCPSVTKFVWLYAIPCSLHTRFLCPPLSPRVCSNSCPLSWWCYLTISSSAPLSVLPSIFPIIRVFKNELALCITGQHIAASGSVLPMNIQGWFLLGWACLISLLSKGLSRIFFSTTVQKHLWCSAFFMVQLSYPYVPTWKTIALTRRTFVCKVMSLLFNMLSSFVTAFLPKSKCLLISWLQSPSAVILEPKKVKSVTAPTFFPFYLPWNDGTRCHDLSSFNIEFKARFFIVLKKL